MENAWSKIASSGYRLTLTLATKAQAILGRSVNILTTAAGFQAMLLMYIPLNLHSHKSLEQLICALLPHFNRTFTGPKAPG